MQATIIVGGSVAQKPYQAGHTWQFLQYLLGFRRLGYDVLFLDRDRNDYLDGVMRTFAIPYAIVGEEGVRERVRDSVLFLNVMGFVDDEELLDAAPLSVFLDTDPGYPQMWRELGLADVFVGHDRYVTIAENIGRPGCTIPTCGIDWITTPQPVLLDQWRPNGLTPEGAFTSVGAWRGPYAPIEYDGTTYGLRVHEFRKFGELPRRCDERFEVALDIDQAETPDLRMLDENGWTLVDPAEAARDPFTYREFVGASKAEFLVARGIYVHSRSGWVSERSMCYLASGKPVLAQDTGLDGLYETGEGLLTFSTLDEAVAGVEEIAGDYARHARAARELAEEHFDSDKVLARLLEAVA